MATATVKKTKPSWKTMADLLDRLGDVPPERVWLDPRPGTATEKDVIAARSGLERRLCELVQGTLVEKAMGTKESAIAILVRHFILEYLSDKDLGLVLGADGTFRLRLGLVRIPDVAFISWNRLPEGELPDEAIASLVPEMAVEVLSPSNTAREMTLKVEEYFKAGVLLVWLIDPKKRMAEEYSAPDKCRRVSITQALDGHGVLPGFTLPLKQLFAGTRRGKQRRLS
jgi:Uma2 family endonuclease